MLESRGEGEGEVIDALVIELGKTISQELFGALLALALSSCLADNCLVTETEPREKTDENLQFICCRNSIFNFCSE